MADSDEKKPWGDNFDEEKAWTLIQGLRSDKRALQTANGELKTQVSDLTTERDDAVKAKTTAESELANDRRASVLREFEIDEDDAAEFLPDGLSLDELRRKAERLAKRNAAKGEKEKKTGDEPQEGADADKGDDDKGDADKGDEPGSGLPGRPKPNLIPGHGEGAPGADLDLDAIARAARRRWRPIS